MRNWALILSLFCMAVTVAAKPNNFENQNDLKGWKAGDGGAIKLSSESFKAGKSSLKWTWRKPGASFEYKNSSAFRKLSKGRAATDSSSGLMLWVYNPKPVDDSLTFEIRRGGKTLIKFPFVMNFKGWRVLTASYWYNFKTVPDGADTVKITVPRKLRSGTLYFDWFDPAYKFNWRFMSADFQMPWGRNDKGVNHWVDYLNNYNQPWPVTPVKKLTPLQDRQLEKIAEAMTELARDQARYPELLKKVNPAKVLREYDKMNIHRTSAGILVGRPIHFRLKYPNGLDIKKYFNLLLEVAAAYRKTADTAMKKKLLTAYFNMIDYLEVSGMAEGSVGNGGMHHLGYASRPWGPALAVMRKELKETGRLEKASAALNWFSILWKIKQKNPEPNYDNFNTQMYNMLTGIMLIGDDREKATALKCFSRWISKGMWVNTDPCGSAHHHNMLHPGYVFRPLVMLTKVNLILSNSDFALGQEARQLLKNAVLAMHFAHYGETPRGIAGRCPQVRSFDSDCEGLLNLALAGSPDGKEKIDLEAAAYYIAKKGVNDKYSEKFLAQGIQPAGMKGFLPLQGACVGIQRRGDFLVAVDGMNTFRRGTEFYGWTDTVHAYAKYLNFGSLQIFLKGKPSREANGWKVEGWDFNHWPGVTNAVLPQQKLYTYYGAVNNASAFCGSTELDGNGVWAMELNSFRQKAHKSVFFFDNVLVCVGSAINNKESGNTVTTLFQSALKSPNAPIIDNGKKITGFPWNKSTKKPVWLMDNMDNGYIVPAGNPVLNVARCKQQMTYTLAKYRKDERNSKKRNDRSVFRIDGKPYNLSDYKTTSADYALAWLDHGKAPRNGKYAYTVVVNSTPAEVKKQFDAPDWKILRQDDDIHVVESVKSGMTGYVFFKSQNKVPGKSQIKFVSRPCIIMTRRTGDKLELSIASPVKNDMSSFVIIVEGLWEGKGAATSAKFTKIVIPFKNFMPHKLVLTTKK